MLAPAIGGDKTFSEATFADGSPAATRRAGMLQASMCDSPEKMSGTVVAVSNHAN